MKYLKQFGIIIAISFFGELLNRFLPLPVPASIYGIVILFVLLETGIIKKESVKDVSRFLIEIMPVMFVPAAVGLIESFDIMKQNLVVYIVITVITTFVVMVISGRVTQSVIKLVEKRKKLDE